MNHKSQPSCCDKGYAYDNQTARCTHNPFCSLECVEREGTRTTLVPKTTQAFTERTTILVYYTIILITLVGFLADMHVHCI